MTNPTAAKDALLPCREAFHQWYVDPDNPRGLRRSDTNPDGYHLMQAQLAWEAWKACWNTRAALASSQPSEREKKLVEALRGIIAEWGGGNGYSPTFLGRDIAKASDLLTAYDDQQKGGKDA